MSTVVYTDTPAGLSPDQLQGFFKGWPNPPDPAALLRILESSDHIALAREGETGRVVGFITAISDGVSAAYIPHLEVIESMQGQGIGSELTRRMVDRLRSLYMVDLVCDPDLQPFYERLGFRRYSAMVIRNYDRQRCNWRPRSGYSSSSTALTRRSICSTVWVAKIATRSAPPSGVLE